MRDWEASIRLVIALLAGLAGIVGTLLLLSQAASARPMAQEPEANLAIAKTGWPDTVIAGTALTYTVAITNNGPSTATGVLVTDTLPSGVSFASSSPGLPTCTEWEGVVTCGLNTLTNGESATVIITVDVPPSRPAGVIRNTATASSDVPDPDETDNTASLETPIIEVVSLQISKAAPPTVDAGERLTYTIQITNEGPSDATGVVVTDDLPSGVYFVSSLPGPPTCTEYEGIVTCDLGTLASGAAETVVITATAVSPLPNGTLLVNTAWLDADQSAPISATQQTTVRSSPLLSITTTDYPDPVETTGSLRYTLVITNSGNENATSVTITEYYDPNVSFFYAAPAADPGSGNRVWTFPTIAVGSPKTIDIIVRVTDTLPTATVLTNQVTLDSDQTAPVTVTEVTDVASAAELSISKIEHADPIPAGDTLIYFITYQISGTAPAEDVVITETYDSHMTFINANPQPVAGTDNVWSVGDLPVNGSGTIIVSVHVDTPLTNGMTLTNVVTIDSAHTNPRTFTKTTHVSSAPDLTLSVADHPDPVDAGAPISYTLRYTNTGNADATGVIVTATLDSRVVLSGAVPPPAGGGGHVWYWHVGAISGEGGHGQIIVHADVPISVPNRTKLGFEARLGDLQGDFLEREAQTTVTRLPDLTIQKTGEGHRPALFSPGKLMTYTLTYGSAGHEDARDVMITTTLPVSTTYVGYGWQPSQDGQTYTYTTPHLPAGSTGHALTFTVRHADSPQIGAPHFETPFAITEHGGAGGDIEPGDNTTHVFIGVPDLVISDWAVEPWPLQPDVPVTFTVMIENQGTGKALNPDIWGSFYVDVFLSPVASYPYEKNGTCYTISPIIEPQDWRSLAITHSGFSTREIRETWALYVKADNHKFYPYGLIPESNEMNNLGAPIYLRPHHIYLPLIRRNWEENTD